MPKYRTICFTLNLPLGASRGADSLAASVAWDRGRRRACSADTREQTRGRLVAGILLKIIYKALVTTPEEVTRRMTSDIAKWRKVQQQTGIRID